jgi:mono/diheme cytochrome c family protein
VAAYVAASAGQGGAAAAPPKVGNDGKAIFSANCASCHTLKAANATGKIGPNLDTLKPAEPIVVHQVEVGGGPMPAFKGKLTDAQIAAVAKFVSSSAGK